MVEGRDGPLQRGTVWAEGGCCGARAWASRRERLGRPAPQANGPRARANVVTLRPAGQTQRSADGSQPGTLGTLWDRALHGAGSRGSVQLASRRKRNLLEDRAGREPQRRPRRAPARTTQSDVIFHSLHPPPERAKEDALRAPCSYSLVPSPAPHTMGRPGGAHASSLLKGLVRVRDGVAVVLVELREGRDDGGQRPRRLSGERTVRWGRT